MGGAELFPTLYMRCHNFAVSVVGASIRANRSTTEKRPMYPVRKLAQAMPVPWRRRVWDTSEEDIVEVEMD